MVISRETDYAIRVLRALADGELHNISQLCASEHIPKPFGYRIIDKLQNAGILMCVRGRNGGGQLVKDLHTVSMYDVLTAIGNDVYLNECLTPGHVCEWQEAHNDVCRVHHNLAALQLNWDNTLKGLNMYSVIFEGLQI